MIKPSKQFFLRHSNIAITMNIYVKSVSESQVSAMDSLSEKLGICNDHTTNQRDPFKLKIHNFLFHNEISGGAGEARTPDLRFRKPTLYPSELQPRGLAKHRLPQRREAL